MKDTDIIHATKRFEIEVFEPSATVHERSEEDTPENIAYCRGCDLGDCMFDTLELCKKNGRKPIEQRRKRGRPKTVIPDFEAHYKRLQNKEIRKCHLAEELGISRKNLDAIIKRYLKSI